jgi:hypothetical protein
MILCIKVIVCAPLSGSLHGIVTVHVSVFEREYTTFCECALCTWSMHVRVLILPGLGSRALADRMHGADVGRCQW